MSKPAEIAQTSTKGGFHLLWGLVLSSIITSVGAIFIARLLGSELYGLYVIVLTVPNLITLFKDWGINSAMIRFIAQYTAEGRTSEVKSIILAGTIFEIGSGFLLSLGTFFASGLLASIFNRPEIAPLIQIASFSILASALITATTAVFTGLERMEYNSILLICQAIVRTGVIIGLVVLGFGTLGAVIGYSVSFVVGGLVGVLFVWHLYKKLPKIQAPSLQIRAYTKEMLKYGLPLSLSTILSGVQTQFFAFLLPIYYVTDNTAIGNYGIAINFVVLISFFATPITTMLFPAFSKLDYRKEPMALKKVFHYSVKYSALLVVPVTAIVICLSQPAVSTLFGLTYTLAPLFLSLLAINYLFAAFGNLSVSNLINGQGQTTFNLYMEILTMSIGIPMGLLLILNFGVLGLIVTTLTAGWPSFIISLIWIKKRYGVGVEWVSSSKIFFSSALAAALTYVLVVESSFADWIELILGLVFFVVVFVLMAVFTHTIDRSDLDNLRDMTSTLGPLRKIIAFFLALIGKLMDLARI
ncbi:MAG: flippase [Candidatus Bathyarchaeota archaeon]|nr:flippase [Candidatus Bathyarchaeota archaeon]